MKEHGSPSHRYNVKALVNSDFMQAVAAASAHRLIIDETNLRALANSASIPVKGEAGAHALFAQVHAELGADAELVIEKDVAPGTLMDRLTLRVMHADPQLARGRVLAVSLKENL